jgi:hypothetical protein
VEEAAQIDAVLDRRMGDVEAGLDVGISFAIVGRADAVFTDQ